MALDGKTPDDKRLSRLLADAGSALDAAAVRGLVDGVIAAPAAPDTDAGTDIWMNLVAPEPGDELRVALAAIRDEAAAETGGRAKAGLDAEATDPARLQALREELARLGLGGFIVPRSDEHQGEYVSRRAQRLCWLTGFTGSAGLAVVLADTAAVFVDGRYTLQAEAEVDGALFERLHLTDTPPTDWIAAKLPAGATLAYDPWLLTPNQVARYQAACTQVGGTLVATDANPLDAVWADQPVAPISPVQIHDDAFAGGAAADKRMGIAEGLKGRRIDAAVLTAPDSIAWLLNVRGGDVPYTPLVLSFAIVAADARVEWFVDGRKLTPAVRDRLGPEVDVAEPDAFGPALDRLGEDARTVRLDPDGAPQWVLQRLEAAGARVERGDDPCQLAKARKSSAQIEGIRAAHKRDGASLTRFLAWLAAEAPGGAVTELVAADKLETFRRGNEHFRGLSFPTISGAGANGAIVHYRVSEKTDRRLEPGTLYLVDSGAQYLDGTTDVTRTVAVGPPTDEMRHHFTCVLKGHIAVATARFPEGTSGSQLDTLARHALWQAGLDYDHGTGHGVGHYLGVHEGPQRIAKAPNRVALEPGMVVSNEPGYYKAGHYGIRIENLVTVVPVEAPEGADRRLLGFETLTLAPIDRHLVNPDLLDAHEAAWLDAYHARVTAELAPLVDDETRAWLEDAAGPL